MRISDWSSDVCSSDLDVALDGDRIIIAIGDLGRAAEFILRLLRDDADDAGARILAEQRRLRAAQQFDTLDVRKVADLSGRARAIDAVDDDADRRSEERRGGPECVSTCKSRWSADH